MFLNLNLLLPTAPVFFCWVQNSKIYNKVVKSGFAIAVLFSSFGVSAQTVTNGNFSNTSSGWGCSPEATYMEKTYGGTSTSNRVAEVDKQVGLCQTISGFTIGHEYELSFKCSRRTTCGPTLQTMDVTVSGGVLSATISRNGGGFSFTTESFTFVASATSHTITFTGTVSGTCGLIVDDVAVVSALPVDLIHFGSKLDENGTVTHNWATAMELNNDYFTLEQSIDGIKWSEITVINGAGNSTTILRYQTTNDNAIEGISYYRLKQTDFDGTFTYSAVNPVRSNRKETQSIKAYPNPATSQVTISNVGPTATIKIINSVGQDLTRRVLPEINAHSSEVVINLTLLPHGVYYIRVDGQTTAVNKI